MLCFVAADRRETPDLLTRFREEHYATKAHKAWVASLQRADNEGDQAGAGSLAILAAEQRALRSEYFKTLRKKAAKPHKGQKRLLDAR